MSKHTIDQHYQTQKPSVTAPAHLDDAIINQAKEAIEPSTGSSGTPIQLAKKPWLVPLSTAATVMVCGLTVLFVSNTPSEPEYYAAKNVATEGTASVFEENEQYAEAASEDRDATLAKMIEWIESEDSRTTEETTVVARADIEYAQEATAPTPKANLNERFTEEDIIEEVVEGYVAEPVWAYPMETEDVVAEAGSPVDPRSTVPSDHIVTEEQVDNERDAAVHKMMKDAIKMELARQAKVKREHEGQEDVMQELLPQNREKLLTQLEEVRALDETEIDALLNERSQPEFVTVAPAVAPRVIPPPKPQASATASMAKQNDRWQAEEAERRAHTQTPLAKPYETEPAPASYSEPPKVKSLRRWANRVIMLVNGNQITLAKREYNALKKAYPNADEFEALKPYVEKLNSADK